MISTSSSTDALTRILFSASEAITVEPFAEALRRSTEHQIQLTNHKQVAAAGEAFRPHLIFIDLRSFHPDYRWVRAYLWSLERSSCARSASIILICQECDDENQALKRFWGYRPFASPYSTDDLIKLVEFKTSAPDPPLFLELSFSGWPPLGPNCFRANHERLLYTLPSHLARSDKRDRVYEPTKGQWMHIIRHCYGCGLLSLPPWLGDRSIIDGFLYSFEFHRGADHVVSEGQLAGRPAEREHLLELYKALEAIVSSPRPSFDIEDIRLDIVASERGDLVPLACVITNHSEAEVVVKCVVLHSKPLSDWVPETDDHDYILRTAKVLEPAETVRLPLIVEGPTRIDRIVSREEFGALMKAHAGIMIVFGDERWRYHCAVPLPPEVCPQSVAQMKKKILIVGASDSPYSKLFKVVLEKNGGHEVLLSDVTGLVEATGKLQPDVMIVDLPSLYYQYDEIQKMLSGFQLGPYSETTSVVLLCSFLSHEQAKTTRVWGYRVLAMPVSLETLMQAVASA